MIKRCYVCADEHPTREGKTLCYGCWWRLYRIIVKPPNDRRAAREEAEIDYACHVALDNPPPEIASFVVRVLTHRRRPRRRPIAE